MSPRPTGRTAHDGGDGRRGRSRLGVVSCANWQFGHTSTPTRPCRKEARSRCDRAPGRLSSTNTASTAMGARVATQARPRARPDHGDASRCRTTGQRHAQYKSDPNLQAAHAATPRGSAPGTTMKAPTMPTGQVRTEPQSGGTTRASWSDRKHGRHTGLFRVATRSASRKRATVTSAVWRSVRIRRRGNHSPRAGKPADRPLAGHQLEWCPRSVTGNPTQDRAMMAARPGRDCAEAINAPARTMLGRRAGSLAGRRALANPSVRTGQELAGAGQPGRSWRVQEDLPRHGQKVLTPEQLAAQDSPYVRTAWSASPPLASP